LLSFNELGLSWLVCVPYTGAKLGGWISENYLSLARLSCWFYSKLSTVVTDFKFIEPRTPQKDWTMKQKIGWLKVRDLSRGVSSLNAKDLSALVDKYMNQSGGPPPIKQYIGGNVENIEHLVESFPSMISACMQSQYCKRDVELLDLKIKVFLSDHATFDNSMKSRTATSNTVPQGNGMMDFNPSDDEDEDVLIDGINNMREEGDFGGDDDEEDEIDQVGVKNKKKDKPKWLM
jgi:hypothetical protein